MAYMSWLFSFCTGFAYRVLALINAHRIRVMVGIEMIVVGLWRKSPYGFT